MDNDVIDNIKYYIYSEESDYVIMIDGEWGSGKTYFVKNSIIPMITSANLKPLYISLFGVNTLDEIKEKMFYEMIKINGGDILMRKLPTVNRKLKSISLAVKEILVEASKFNISSNYMYQLLNGEI